MKRYFIYLTAALLAFASVSCQKELKYEPGEADHENCYGVYFPIQNGTGDLQIEPSDPTVLKYTLRRTKTDGEALI